MICIHCKGKKFYAFQKEYHNVIVDEKGNRIKEVSYKETEGKPYGPFMCCNCNLKYNMDLDEFKKNVKDSYEDGVCPNCSGDIPEDIIDGQSCENCGHVLWAEKQEK